MANHTAKSLRELSTAYWNAKKNLANAKETDQETRIEIIGFLKSLKLEARKYVRVGIEIKVNGKWVTVTSIQDGRIYPLAYCCDDGMLHECGGVENIR